MMTIWSMITLEWHQPQEWSEQIMTNDDQQCSTIMNNDISRMGKGLQITKKFLQK